LKSRSRPYTDPSLIAPCGINCALCLGYQREKNTCPGCRQGAMPNSSCRRCVIKNCETIQKNASGFCFECEKFPCARMKALQKRYRTKYNTDIFQNLAAIKTGGMDAFLGIQAERWACPACGSLLCMHRSQCTRCGASSPYPVATSKKT